MRQRSRSTRRQQRREREIDVGAFSDIAFLLIIYFMVATTLVKVKSVEAEMPSGETTQQANQEDDTPTVTLVNGEFLFNDKPVALENLNERLAALNLKEKQGDARVILLECTSDTPYDLYFKALAAIAANGGVAAMIEEEK
jgi:biopolymer transport protein ExbD